MSRLGTFLSRLAPWDHADYSLGLSKPGIPSDPGGMCREGGDFNSKESRRPQVPHLGSKPMEV